MCPIKPVFSSLRLSSGAKSNIQQILWIQQMFVTLVFEAGLYICNCILCTHKPYVVVCDTIWHQSIKHPDIYQSGFYGWKIVWRQFHSAGLSESHVAPEASLNMFNSVFLKFFFCPP